VKTRASELGGKTKSHSHKPPSHHASPLPLEARSILHPYKHFPGKTKATSHALRFSLMPVSQPATVITFYYPWLTSSTARGKMRSGCLASGK